jgi:hypothetical protein
MSGYYARGKSGLVRVSTNVYGQQTRRAVPTKTITCDACGWTAQALDAPSASTVLERCICGGTLRVTTAIKEATKLKT